MLSQFQNRAQSASPRHVHFFCALLGLVLAWPSPARPQSRSNPAGGFLAASYHTPSGETMQYRLFVPPHYDAARKYPLVLWLHNAAGRGADNLA
ncbi:MAG: hypothetical protein ACRD41_06285, partial [Candidatus Acidiferrales bacterium]